MISVTDLRKGATFQMNNMPYRVTEYNHIKMGRGGATIRVTIRNLKTGAVEEKTFNSGGSVEPITTTKKKLQYLYQDGQKACFMNPKTYDQVEIDKSVLEDGLVYLKEGQEVDLVFWSFGGDRDDLALGIELPPNVVLGVIEAEPGLRGNSATNIYKPVKLENGLVVKAPLFVKVGDKVRVDTRTGEYVERVSIPAS